MSRNRKQASAAADGRCRGCSGILQQVLLLGQMPLANSLVDPRDFAQSQARFPLTLTVCRSCSLVQIAETIDPELLFRHYVYLSSNSPAFVAHAADLVRRLIPKRGLDSTSLVIEIASNDGYLLQHYRGAGVGVLGIEPAEEIAEVARRRGINTETEFFSLDLAVRLRARGLLADIVHANNVLAHVADLRGFLAGIATILKPGGLAIVEFPYLLDLIDRLEFDTIYHEHLCYFALTPLKSLIAGAKLQLVDVERLSVHGGSLRLFIAHADAEAPGPAVARMLSDEERWGVRDPATYHRFADNVRALAPRIRGFLAGLRQDGNAIAAYGASAKGATLLNYCGIGADLVDFVVDRSPWKQGLAMPGVRLPILATEELLRRRPAYALLLAWNFATEIAAQQREYLNSGGRLIVPVPEPHILTD